MFAVDAPSGPRPLLERVIETPDCYIIPRGTGRILVGATAERVGFRPGPTPSGLRSLIEPAVRVLPALAELPVAETWAGFRPATRMACRSSDPIPMSPGYGTRPATSGTASCSRP